MINSIKKRNEKFKNFLEERRMSMECRMTPLEGFLIKPVQRISTKQLRTVYANLTNLHMQISVVIARDDKKYTYRGVYRSDPPHPYSVSCRLLFLVSLTYFRHPTTWTGPSQDWDGGYYSKRKQAKSWELGKNIWDSTTIRSWRKLAVTLSHA